MSGGGVSYIKVEVRMLPTTHRQIEGLRTDTKLSFNLLLYLHILHFAAPKGLHGIQSNIRYSTERQSLTPFNSNGTLFLGSGYYFNIGFCCKFNHSASKQPSLKATLNYEELITSQGKDITEFENRILKD